MYFFILARSRLAVEKHSFNQGDATAYSAYGRTSRHTRYTRNQKSETRLVVLSVDGAMVRSPVSEEAGAKEEKFPHERTKIGGMRDKVCGVNFSA